MHSFLHKKMDDRIVSTAVLTLSRQQEEFLARYRTHEAQKAYFESYGLGVTPFFRGGGGSHGVIPPSPVPDLPYDYAVEYIEQRYKTTGIFSYIDTGLFIDELDYVIEVDFQYIAPGSYGMIFSNEDRLSGQTHVTLSQIGINSNGIRCTVFNNYNSFLGNMPIENRLTYILNISEGTLKVGSETFNIPVGSPSNNGNTLKIFDYTPSSISNSRLYGFNVSKSNKLIMSLIPVVKDDVGYMYDKISRNFFPPQGGGSFFYGPKI